MWYNGLLLRHDSLCQGHHVRLLHPVRFAGTSPPDSQQTPGISSPSACPVINLFAIAFFSITYELPNWQALCFDIHTTCRGCGGPAPVLASQQLCLFTSANLCVLGVSALSLSGLFRQSRVTSLSRASSGHGFQTFRRRRILLHFSHCSRTKIGS